MYDCREQTYMEYIPHFNIISIYVYIMLYPIIISSIVMLVLDIAYLSTFGKPFVDQTVMIQKSPFELNYIGAMASYLCMIIGLNYFVISKQGSLQDAFVLGIVMYGVYDATNMALLKKWLPDLALMDTLWGATLMTVTTFLTYQSINLLNL